MDQISRTYDQARRQREAGNRAQATEAELNEVAIQRMSAGMAISQLAALDRSANDAQHLDRMHNAQHRGDYVMHAHKTQRVYDRARSFAVDKLSKKISEAEEKQAAAAASSRAAKASARQAATAAPKGT